ncbi:RNA polymerase sigma factor [Euzebya rosea]|uniref:RNA polymerase sigma factor n=1 Tax=Euzebya rosea TaxID=2052804 RepID=UPI000D3E4A3C|nr:sigma-70 family RNA polymerase sigma factor [Euzebya rosea]
MANPHEQDFRRAAEPELLDGIRAGQPLALAEAYHRLVPAAHAVARRLVPGAAEVEEVLQAVFTQLWISPPDAGPLEGWARRTTWAISAERLRADGRAPASPSASGLLPDLPAPDLRFLDAAERAIAELPDDERRALLLTHDKGVATTAQDPGASDALARALLALAGPETSSGDRTAATEDPCADLSALGDWCLGVADTGSAAAVETAIEERAGCAARSRAVRRGRRRIEGLPATPDMGQRVLVQVLTATGAVTAASTPPPAAEPAAMPTPVADATDSPDVESLAGMPLDEAPAADNPADMPDPAPFDAPAVDLDASTAPAPVEEDGEDDDPFTDLDEASPVVGGPVVVAGSDAVADTADLPAATTADPADASADADWTPTPGDTAELRLSDILAGDHEDDDPFAGLDELDEPPSPAGDAPAATGPYAALQALDGEADGPAPDPAAPFGTAAPVERTGDAAPVFTDDADVYVEGEEHYEEEPVVRERSAMAAILAWVLPILGGLAVGVLLAVQVFGPPGG